MPSMKSAYELAMERFAASHPEDSERTVTEEQKAALQDIEIRYKAKIAEREVFLQKQLLDARAQGEHEATGQIETQLRNERARLEDEKEAAKERVRRGE